MEFVGAYFALHIFLLPIRVALNDAFTGGRGKVKELCQLSRNILNTLMISACSPTKATSLSQIALDSEKKPSKVKLKRKTNKSGLSD